MSQDPRPGDGEEPRPQGPEPDGERRPTDDEIRAALRLRRTRRPRYLAFVLTGAVLGLVAAVVLAWLGDPQQYTRAALLGYLTIAGVVLGGLLGGLVAVLTTLRR